MQHLQDIYGKSPCLNTIYTHRKGLTTQHLIDELLRQQERDITKTSLEELRLKYRNELLKILMPIKAEILSKSLSINQSEIKHVIELVDPDNPAQTYSPDEIHAAQRAGIIPPLPSKIPNP
jgi:hypothetical protein